MALVAATMLAGTSACDDAMPQGRAAQAEPMATGGLVDSGPFPRLVYAAEFVRDEVHADWSADGVEAVADTEAGWSGLVLRGDANGSIRVPAPSRPLLGGCDRLVLDLRAEHAHAGAPVEVRIEFHDTARGASFVRTLELARPDAQRFDLPLRFVPYGRGVVPRWDGVDAWGLRFVTGGEVIVDGFELWRDGPDASPDLSVDDLRRLFPLGREVAAYERGPFVVLTDAPALAPEPVLDALARMEDHVRQVVPELPRPRRPVPLVIFATEAEYRAFWPAFASRFGVRVRPLPEDDGYTWRAVATTWWSDEYGDVRPTYVHEASHALLESALGLAAQRSWLFEGLAVVEQLEISRQDLAPVYRRGMMNDRAKVTVAELVSGAPISTTSYWQAALLIEWLLADEARAAGLRSAVAEMRARGSTDLRPLVMRHFGVDLDGFAASFWAWAWTTYGTKLYAAGPRGRRDRGA
jgi:hypothetical protein